MDPNDSADPHDPLDPQDREDFLLSRYLDGDLAPADVRELERHLADEPDLAARLKEFRSVDRMVAEATGPVPELEWERFTDAFIEKRELFDETQRRRRRFRIFTPLAAAAAVLLAVALFKVFLPGTSAPQADRIATVEILPPQAEPATPAAFAEVEIVRVRQVKVTGKGPINRLNGTAVAAVGPDRDSLDGPEPSPYF